MDDWAPNITEEYDHTWPFNFKWGISAEGQVDVWRVQGGVQDGKPYHRQELGRRWGREVHVGSGDMLGSAQYIPAEMKMDGTVVAPPEVQVQTYYSHPLQPALVNWFELRFPGTVVREAAYRTPVRKTAEWQPQWGGDYEEEGVEEIKWIWNDEGMIVWKTDGDGRPYHGEKCRDVLGRPLKTGVWIEGGDIDFCGYAIPTGYGTMEVEQYQELPPKAVSRVKAELAKQFPDYKLVVPRAWDDPRDDSFDPDMHDKQILRERQASATWARENLTTPKDSSVAVKASEIDSPGLRNERGVRLPEVVSDALGRLRERFHSKPGDLDV